MQIASGWSKGLKILTPSGLDTRPTRERVRSSALNLLQPWIADARVLDLFAGSGAVGLELISRGAVGCQFVEIAPAAVKCLKSNMAALAARAEKEDLQPSPFALVQGDAAKTIESLADQSFDLIWADPPYELVPEFMTNTAPHLARVLTTDGVLTLESSEKDTAFLDTLTDKLKLTKIKQRAYGVSLITIWQK